MSYGDDIAAEAIFDEDEFRIRIKEEAERGVWTTRDGKEIAVKDMTTSHIQNTINYIKRVDTTDLMFPWITVFEAEFKRREKRGR